MYFRFGSAIVLVVLISLVGIGLEKRNLELRRAVSQQHYRMDALRDVHARLRLETQLLGAPVRTIDSLDRGQLEVERPEKPVQTEDRRMPLLFWR
ncbi:MAG: hypothetical protein AB7O26_16625 [Planctomycetaceae bacterium]